VADGVNPLTGRWPLVGELQFRDVGRHGIQLDQGKVAAFVADENAAADLAHRKSDGQHIAGPTAWQC
jgi:hypothetical protein